MTTERSGPEQNDEPDMVIKTRNELADLALFIAGDRIANDPVAKLTLNIKAYEILQDVFADVIDLVADSMMRALGNRGKAENDA